MTAIQHLTLTHIRIAFHSVKYLSQSQWYPEGDPLQELKLQSVASRLTSTVPTLEYIFLENAGFIRKPTRKAPEYHGDGDCPPEEAWRFFKAWKVTDMTHRYMAEISVMEAERVIAQEELQLVTAGRGG